MVSEVVRNVANADFEEAEGGGVGNTYQLMLKRFKLMNAIVFHFFESFGLFVFGPFLRYQKFILHTKINHKQRKRIDAGQFAMVVLFQNYIFLKFTSIS